MKTTTRFSSMAASAGRCRGDRGAALAEAALALPMLLTMVFGGIDYAYTELQYSTFASAARDGSRAAIINPPTSTATSVAFSGSSCTGGDANARAACTAITKRLAGSGKAITTITFSCYGDAYSTAPAVNCSTVKNGYTIQTSIVWTVKPFSFVGKTFVGNRTVTSTSRMVVL